ncbi:hypothetical protein AGLY_008084 [Aphis glycines]|uniref:Uncharacterized protein n=1 Tax=Aphis glycines TaxID=307491 RepID=A0A6G0TKU5_APHGL|nr:hypothetical protein AGLY_008084 [Aphis glycines]
MNKKKLCCRDKHISRKKCFCRLDVTILLLNAFYLRACYNAEDHKFIKLTLKLWTYTTFISSLTSYLICLESAEGADFYQLNKLKKIVNLPSLDCIKNKLQDATIIKSKLHIGTVGLHHIHISYAGSNFCVSLKKKYQTTIGFTVFIININITNIVSSRELIKSSNIKIAYE